MPIYFDKDGELTEADHELCRQKFEAHHSKLPAYSLTPVYCGETDQRSSRPRRDYFWVGYLNRETQGDWCRWFDGWKACRKQQIEENR